MMNSGEVARLIDHSLLKPDATEADIKRLCREAVRCGFYSVCVNPHFIQTAKQALSGSGVKVVTVIGFPLGMNLASAKVYEAMQAGLLGADELDVVINIGRAKSGDWQTVQRDLRGVILVTEGLLHKAIIECCYLTNKEKAKAVEVCLEAGADFIKTSTGFGTGGATVEDVRLIKKVLGESPAGIKAAGGIKTLRDVMEMVEAGATRIGTSNGVSIIREAK
ncbi:MAG: deoxyribose-phosphate aldolase [Thermodesulfovibrionales bacterium]|nr:deoxyribose-phosphate aldolase [Thermodesulfovibrionales bacterium]